MVLDFGLKAQSRLLPYALGLFGIGLPIFLWTAVYAMPLSAVGVILLVFVINWALLLWLRARVDRQVRDEADTGPSSRSIYDRLWRQGLGGGLWAVTLLCISMTAARWGGHNAEYVLMVCAGGAASLIFFCSPVLLFLLVLAPIAIVGPVMGLRMLSLDWDLASLVSGGLFLAWAMSFVVNRHLREHYHLEHRRSVLAQEREAALETARRQSDARSALMEVLSREVQSGLRAVINDLSLGAEHLSRAPAPRQHVHAALEEARHLQSLLVTTLDNDTASSGQLSVVKEPVDLAVLCQASAGSARERLHLKGLTFALNLTALPSTGAAIGDPHRIQQVLDQLLDNAIAYTAAGKVEIRIMPPADGFIRIEVLDSGPGLTPDEWVEAFRPHGRVARTCAGTSGAGLGLSLSQSLAKLMGGRVDGESTLDIGSKFWIDLRWDPLALLPLKSESEPAANEATVSSLRVLVVAPNSLETAQLRAALESLGHKCLSSSTPERALNLARKAPVDACLMSIQAFAGVGVQSLESFAEALGHAQALPQRRCVALLPDGEHAERLSRLGITPLLAPFSREAIGRAMAQLEI